MESDNDENVTDEGKVQPSPSAKLDICNNDYDASPQTDQYAEFCVDPPLLESPHLKTNQLLLRTPYRMLKTT